MYQYFLILVLILFYLLKQKKKVENFSDNTDKYFKDVLTVDENKKINFLFKNLVDHLEKKKIKYFICFGTLLGAIRHGFRMPWDDDIDILINKEEINKLLNGLKVIKKNKNDKHYYLNKKIKIIHKNWGCPLKIMLNDKSFPFIDIFTYYNKNNNIIVPRSQLANSHVIELNEKYEDIFPLKKAKFNDLILNIPRNYKKVLKKLYGDKALDECVITWNHKMSKNQKKNFKKKIIKISDVNKKYIKPHIY
jgi:phosphorylcholine metabolism protein LicD